MRSLKLPTDNQGQKSIPEDATAVNLTNQPITSQPIDRLQEIGANLRHLRQQRGLSIEEVSARTQIQPRLIEAIEKAQVDLLPESVYVKGMVKRYGDSMGLDGAALAQDVAGWQQQTFNTTKPSRRTTIVIQHRIKPLHLYLGYMLLVGGGIAGISQVLNTTFKPKQPQPIVQTAMPAVSKPAVKSSQPPVTQPQNKLAIEIVVKSPATIKVVVDGKTQFTGDLKAGEKRSWGAQQQVSIETNNAGGILLSRDRQPAQPLGKAGEKRQFNFQVNPPKQ